MDTPEDKDSQTSDSQADGQEDSSSQCFDQRSDLNPGGAGWPLHQLVAFALILVILGMLAMLWVRERRLRAAAEGNAATFKQQRDYLLKSQSMALPLEKIMGKTPGKLTERDVLRTSPGVVEGKKVSVKIISAWPASQVGLKIGDVVAVVAEEEDLPAVTTNPAGD